ncbi:hypothetical protein T4C_11977 [Trichinella pseudospiralis]|uniref:Uncharacterized protein n=1 Tax=Trichinella pseudospiralis TaxID=6337 RepID=A0A0V1JN51_TRIPS|nr:hypothetical protein T4C_11977 [Trichinella pseudospiralis]
MRKMSVSDEYGRHQQSGTTTSGNLVGAAIRPRNLGANLKAKIQEGRNGVTSSNYWKQRTAFSQRPEPVPKPIYRHDDCFAEVPSRI